MHRSSARRVTPLTATVFLSVALPASRIFAEQTTALGTEGYIAGTGNPTLTTGDAPDSICPSGWRLPKDRTNNQSYNTLILLYAARNNWVPDPIIIMPPVNATRTGPYSNGLSGSPYGYWSSSINGIYAYYLYHTDGDLAPGQSSARGTGWTLRCLAR